MPNIISASCSPHRPIISSPSSSTAARTRSSTTRISRILPEASVEQRGGQQRASDPDGLGDQPAMDGGDRPPQQNQPSQHNRQQRDYRDNRDQGRDQNRDQGNRDQNRDQGNRDQGNREQGSRDQGRDQNRDQNRDQGNRDQNRDQGGQPYQPRDRFKPRWQDRRNEGQQPGQQGEPRQNNQPSRSPAWTSSPAWWTPWWRRRLRRPSLPSSPPCRKPTSGRLLPSCAARHPLPSSVTPVRGEPGRGGTCSSRRGSRTGQAQVRAQAPQGPCRRTAGQGTRCRLRRGISLFRSACRPANT